MRNVEKIKQLEKELGRYKKKVVDQQKELAKLKTENEDFKVGSHQVNALVNAAIIAFALKYGEKINDEETGADLGYRLSVPPYNVTEYCKKYEVRTRKDDKAEMLYIGVVPREEKPNAE